MRVIVSAILIFALNVADADWLIETMPGTRSGFDSRTAVTFGGNGGGLGVTCTEIGPVVVIQTSMALGSELDSYSLSYRVDKNPSVELIARTTAGSPKSLIVSAGYSGAKVYDRLINDIRKGRSISLEYANAQGAIDSGTFSLKGASAKLDTVLANCTKPRSNAEIRAVFDRNRAATYSLYNWALRRDPDLNGRVLIRLVIEPDGTVSDSVVISSDLNNPNLETRLAQRVSQFQFEAKDVLKTTAVEPLDFESQDSLASNREDLEADLTLARRQLAPKIPEAAETAIRETWQAARLRQEAEEQQVARAAQLAADKQIRKEKALSQAIAELEIDSNEIVLWGPEGPSASKITGRSTDEAIDELTVRFFEHRASLVEEFEPPEKGEFEKTVDFDTRVAESRDAWQEAQSVRIRSFEEKSNGVLSDQLASTFGRPRVQSANYSADDEVFTLEILSSSGFGFNLPIQVPIEDAPARKGWLIDATPYVAFRFKRGELHLVALVLQNSNEVVSVAAGAQQISFDITESRLARYQEAKRMEAEVRQEQQRLAREAKAKEFPYYATFRCVVGGNSMPMSACLRTDGTLGVQTANDTRYFALRDVASSYSEDYDLTERFKVVAQVGSRSRFGAIEIEVVDRLSGRVVGRTVANGAADFASIVN